jgi:hypothetical protein
MTIFKVETYVIKPEKGEEYHTIVKKWSAYMKKNKEKCKELKSWRLFSQTIGDNIGAYIEMWEIESLADYEKLMNRIMRDEEFLTLSRPFFRDCLVPGTYSVSIWNSVM